MEESLLFVTKYVYNLTCCFECVLLIPYMGLFTARAIDTHIQPVVLCLYIERLGTVLELVRWDPCRPGTCDNIVVMSSQALRTFTGPESVQDVTLRQQVEDRLATCRIDACAPSPPLRQPRPLVTLNRETMYGGETKSTYLVICLIHVLAVQAVWRTSINADFRRFSVTLLLPQLTHILDTILS
jgi:hypothetical protein